MRYRARIIVPANTTDFNQKILAAVQPVVAPDFDVDVRNITGGMPQIECRADLFSNAPYVMELARQSEAEGIDGIFVTDFDMCGVEPSRELVSIPIIGGFTAIAFTAMALSDRFSIITVLDSVVAMQSEHVKRYAVSENFASIRAINVPVHDLGNLELVRRRVFEESLCAIRQDGAESILLGCTGFIDVAGPVQAMLAMEGLPAPVFDPNRTSFAFLQFLVRARLAQSRLTYYVPPDWQAVRVAAAG